VCALLSGGGYAERVAVDAGQLLPVPDGVDLVDAAALPEVACTVWSNVVAGAGLRAGEALLVHGGASGIGTFAVQLGVALGATVIATASRAKHDEVRALGASAVIDYRAEDFVTETARLTGGAGVDVILDLMGAAYLGRNVAALADGGRLVVIGLQGGRRAELDLGMLLAKRATVSATSLRGRPAAQKSMIVSGVLADVWPLVATGAVLPVVRRRLPLPLASQAHRILEDGAHVGKVVLVRA
jgi:putative PIG3 family NAD(P)H quinone oxidoreductase